jgi:hypothetical protein
MANVLSRRALPRTTCVYHCGQTLRYGPIATGSLQIYKYHNELSRSQDNSVSIVTRRRVARQGVRFLAGAGIFFSSLPALLPNQSLIQLVTDALSQGLKRPGREAHHIPPSIAEVKNTWSYTSTPPHTFMASYLVNYKAKAYLLEGDYHIILDLQKCFQN